MIYTFQKTIKIIVNTVEISRKEFSQLKNQNYFPVSLRPEQSFTWSAIKEPNTCAVTTARENLIGAYRCIVKGIHQTFLRRFFKINWKEHSEEH